MRHVELCETNRLGLAAHRGQPWLAEAFDVSSWPTAAVAWSLGMIYFNTGDQLFTFDAF